jgi:hypothetical protein
MLLWRVAVPGKGIPPLGGAMKLGWRSLVVLTGVLVLVFSLILSPAAQERGSEDIPKVLLSGLAAYKAEGPEAAIRAWLKGSALEGSREAMSQANVLRQIQDFYGVYKNYHVVCSRKVAPTTRVFFLSLDFEKGPLFGRFALYDVGDAWVLVYFDFNTKDHAIIPTTC